MPNHSPPRRQRRSGLVKTKLGALAEHLELHLQPAAQVRLARALVATRMTEWGAAFASVVGGSQGSRAVHGSIQRDATIGPGIRPRVCIDLLHEVFRS